MIQIRDMREEDVDAVWEIEQKCFSRPWTRQALAETVSDPTARYMVAFDEAAEKVVGYVGAYLIFDEADINQVAVAKGCRRQGIAMELMDDFWQKLEAGGTKTMSLEVRVSNIPAIRLYEKCGFQIVGERKNFYEAPTENAYIMRKKKESQN